MAFRGYPSQQPARGLFQQPIWPDVPLRARDPLEQPNWRDESPPARGLSQQPFRRDVPPNARGLPQQSIRRDVTLPVRGPLQPTWRDESPPARGLSQQPFRRDVPPNARGLPQQSIRRDVTLPVRGPLQPTWRDESPPARGLSQQPIWEGVPLPARGPSEELTWKDEPLPARAPSQQFIWGDVRPPARAPSEQFTQEDEFLPARDSFQQSTREDVLPPARDPSQQYNRRDEFSPARAPFQQSTQEDVVLPARAPSEQFARQDGFPPTRNPSQQSSRLPPARDPSQQYTRRDEFPPARASIQQSTRLPSARAPSEQFTRQDEFPPAQDLYEQYTRRDVLPPTRVPSEQLTRQDEFPPIRDLSQQSTRGNQFSPTRRPSQGYISQTTNSSVPNEGVIQQNGIPHPNEAGGLVQWNGIHYFNELEASDDVEESIEDVWIAVMGVTGAGKSSFIEQCTGQKVTIGHDLISCTATVEEYAFTVGNTNVHLIDTPGFDDTHRKDTDVLRDISTWLGVTYQANIRLNGIIYLHRISDQRMQGSAKHNLHLFKKLIGENCFSRVVLATTMWENVDPSDGIRRENELESTEDFWGFMRKKGSQIMRHEKNNRQSAMKVLGHFLRRKNAKVTLAIQDEMINHGLDLHETGAGQQITEEIAILQENHREELKQLEIEIQEAKDQESIASIQNLQKEYEQKIKEARKDRESIRASMARLQEEQKLQLQEIERRHALEAEGWKRDKMEWESLKSQAGSDDREHIEKELERKNKELEAIYHRNVQRRKTGGPNARTLNWLEWLACTPHSGAYGVRANRD